MNSRLGIVLNPVLLFAAGAWLAVAFAPMPALAQLASMLEIAQAFAAPRAEEETCLGCHGGKGIRPVAPIADTPHGTRADRRTPGCADCHGDSAAHAGDPMGTPTERRYSGSAPAPASERNGACLSCHQDTRMSHWAGSAHESNDVACTACHDIHSGRDRVLSRATQSEPCLACHTRQRAQLRKPSRHPILEGKVACTDCHAPHGAAGPALMARDTVNDTCFKCHAEKRGPFIWNHQPVTENCALCHEPHGTTVASMLKWRQPFLCQQCHEVSGHPGAGVGGIPSLTVPGTTSGTGITLARSCSNCHTNIHGSNNPTNNAGSRSFRR